MPLSGSSATTRVQDPSLPPSGSSGDWHPLVERVRQAAAAALSALAIGLLLVPGLLGAVLPSSWEDAVLPYLPSTAGEAFTSVTTDASQLSPAAGLAVFAAWVVALRGLAAWQLRTRDVQSRAQWE